MKTSTGKIYTCDYCGKKSVSAGGMALHEKACTNNPINDTLCKNCSHCLRYDSFDNNSYPRAETEFSCDINHTKMHSPKVLRMNKEKREEIISRCPVMMATIAFGCSTYLKNKIPF